MGRARLAWLLLLPALAMAAPPAEKRAALKHRQDALHQKLETAKRDLATNERSKDDATDQLMEIETAISEANRQLRSLADQQGALRDQLREIERRRLELATKSQRQQGQLSHLLHRQLLTDETNPTRILLGGGDPTQALFDHHLLILLSRAKAGLIADLKNRVAEQGRLAEAAQAKTAELTKVEDALRGSRADLQAKQQTRQQLLARSLEQIKARRREIGGLERDEQRLGKLIADLAARRPRHATTKPPKARPAAPTAATVPDPTIVGGAFAALKGRLPYPVRGQIGNRFGMQRPEGGAPWKGVFFRAPEGAEVRTVAAGEIAYADWMRGFGNLLIVDHGDGFLSVYGNNQALIKRLGDTVEAGEVIATAGASGGNLESGLYFELRHQGRAFDPLSWLRSPR